MEAELIFADITSLNRFELATGRHESFITNQTRIVALDFDVRLGKVFFTDVTENKIFVTHFDTRKRASKVNGVSADFSSYPSGPPFSSEKVNRRSFLLLKVLDFRIKAIFNL